MIKDIDELVKLLLSFGLGGAFVLFIVVQIIRNPLFLIRSWTFLAKTVHKLSGKWKKRAIGAQIEEHINSAIQQFGNEAPAAFSRTAKFEWISSGDDHAVVEENQVVIRVRDDPNITKPLVISTLLYLSEGVIPDSRPYIQMRILSAIDLVLAYRILETGPQLGATNYLTKHYIEPALQDERTSTYFEASDGIDRAGLLTRVVLREYSGLSSMLTGRRPTSSIRVETENFLNFVSRFVDRTIEIPLSFFGRYLRCTLALIAKSEVLERSGITIYKRNFRRDIDIGVHVIYLLSRGDKNIRVGRNVAQWALGEGLISGSIPDRFMLPAESGELIPSECIVCFSSRVGRSVQVSPLEEVQIALSQIVPETLTGEIDVISIARERNALTKIIVQSTVDLDPRKVCIGKNEIKLRLLHEELGSDEIIDFVPWSPDLKELVISALSPLQQQDVFNVSIAPDLLSAKVVVNSSAAAHRAVGTDGINLKVAQRLLSIHIDLTTRDELIAPEDELEDVLRYRIPDIDEGNVEIVKLARRVGRVSKIAVRTDKDLNLRRICIGPGGSMVRAISRDLGREHVSFIFWDEDDLKRCLCEALYPLRKRDIIDVVIDHESKLARVKVKKGRAIARAIGKEGDNVRLAENIIGMKIELSEE